jgi:type IV pilus assembly protein PilA
MGKKGFTLLEMLVVVIIIGILAAIALPQYLSTIEKARSGEAVTNVGSIRTALDRYWYQNAAGTTDIDLLDIDNPNDVTNKLYNYEIISNSSTSDKRIYNIRATRIKNGEKDESTWVQWTQTDNETGRLLRSANLGGPTS